ncbi:MAG: ATP-dependent DNA ligase [Pleurocapsa minor GSE-CHR-MK-17-07R]|jgi:DNA ligase-1|nr:ATP-dependent DNA ligase [Pleurocapsa minor GSE-CHR-MK 17-07R]
MKGFAALYAELDATTKTNDKVAALARYFSSASPEDAAWALYFLSGRRIKNLLNSRKLHAWAIERADVPEWLFGECYDAVGDIAETIAHLLPAPDHTDDRPLSWWVETRLLPLKSAPEEAQREIILEAWDALDGVERFVWNKLITGGFRVGVSQLLITRALENVTRLPGATLAHRLMGEWQPDASFWAQLTAQEDGAAQISRPYPFFLAYAVDEDFTALGPSSDWQVEWKWDGIRSQVIARGGDIFIWSRGEELVTERFPEIASAARALPEGTVIDGEILPWKDGHVLPFALLQQRIGRKNLTKRILQDIPAVVLAYDVLEWGGVDIRERPLDERRALLDSIVGAANSPSLLMSPLVGAQSWDDLAVLMRDARARGVEGFMLKRRTSPYRVGRQRGDWYKWKVSPLTVDAVLVYAQRGSGKRASLYTDYTFAVWDENRQLVPFAKAYSGLTDAEIRQVDAYVRRSTIEKFGPVRTVTPELVFELAFEGIQRSGRHKSGIAVRFPRIANWRRDKSIEEADTLETIRAMLPPESAE